ncbi:hypothetical protein THASP1DRAFT_21455 [Thamnocephalis sphaerospora]|uniref:GCF C-terminal domain-containing protein n=1 Tax=Thamnocephalis sphaerospora TaxID=78915 RepID=A0A4P9XX72_9FUNG|nr:hypothetical protein THASP1DRAFT_21455 [Thamnocephalis sphaerospora]|eukprot:RKP10904.1 hypothetical protein THASP1DRAFT_21455 [Thamnocephalis sphaerospora]
MSSVPRKKKDGGLKKKKKKETLLSFSMDEETGEEAFQLKKNVVSAVAKESREKALLADDDTSGAASPFAYSPAPTGDHEGAYIPDANAIAAAKKQRAARRKVADWKHAVLTGDDAPENVNFLVTDVQSTKELQDADAIASDRSDAEEFHAYEDQLIRKAAPKFAKICSCGDASAPKVVACPSVNDVAARVASVLAEADTQLGANRHALHAAQSGHNSATTSLQSLSTDTEKHCARFEFFEEFKRYVDNLADLTDAKILILEDVERELAQTRKDAFIQTGQKWFSTLCDAASESSVDDAIAQVLKAEQALVAEYCATQLGHSRQTLADVDEEYRSLDAVCSKFASWAQNYTQEYETAYVEACIPAVLELYIRMDMLSWTPFQGVALRDMPWIAAIENGAYQEPKKLVATALRKTVMPRVDLSYFILYSTQQTHAITDLFVALRGYGVGLERYQLLGNICHLGSDAELEALSPAFERLLDMVRAKQPLLLQDDAFRAILARVPQHWRRSPVYVALANGA